MEFDKTLTPEEQWDKVKTKIFIGEIPKDIDEVVHKGFRESKSEYEKLNWLTMVLSSIRQRVNNSN